MKVFCTESGEEWATALEIMKEIKAKPAGKVAGLRYFWIEDNHRKELIVIALGKSITKAEFAAELINKKRSPSVSGKQEFEVHI